MEIRKTELRSLAGSVDNFRSFALKRVVAFGSCELFLFKWIFLHGVNCTSIIKKKKKDSSSSSKQNPDIQDSNQLNQNLCV